MAESKKISPLKNLFGALGTSALSALGPAGIALGAAGLFFGAGAIKKGQRRRQAELKRAQEEFDKRLQTYEDSEFQEIDPDKFRQENIFEDITVDTEAQEFASEQFKQQQANIMQAFKGVTGSSGIGALSQSLSNQAAKAAKQNQVEISKQLAVNKKIRLAEQSRLQEQQRQMKLDNAIGRRQFEADKMATMIGVAGQKVAGANQKIANVQSMYGQIIGGLIEAGGSMAGAYIGSFDR